MRFRLHNQSDYRPIAELRWLLKTMPEEGEPSLDPALHAPFIEGYVAQLRASDSAKDTVHWVAENKDENGLVGALTIRLVRKEFSPGKDAGCWGYLTNVFIREGYRNHGHGAELLGRAIAWSREQRLELLIVWPSERSYPFYRRAGFTGGDDPLVLDLE